MTTGRALGTASRALLQAMRRALLLLLLLPLLGGCLDDASGTCFDWDNTTYDPVGGRSCDETAGAGLVVIDYVSPAGDFVLLVNNGTEAEALTDWTLEQEGNATIYTFPAFTLNVDASVVVLSATGTNTATKLYWDPGASWTASDTANLKDETGILIDTCPYTNTTCWGQ